MAEVVKHRYKSTIDGTFHRYNVARPARYNARRKYPVICCLHGFGGNEDSGINDVLLQCADERGYLIVSSSGRGGTFYDGVGEDDFLRVLEAVQRKYSVDEDRVYLIGTSMGGTGVWRLATRYPDKFAATVPICGWADLRYWYTHWYTSAARPDEIDPFRKPLLEGASARYLAENLMHVPVYIMHGGRDSVVEVEESRSAYQRLKQLGYEVVFKEYLRSKHAGFVRKWRRVFDWFDGRAVPSWVDGKERRARAPGGAKTRPRWPTRVAHKANSLRYGQAYWTRIDSLIKPTEFGSIDARVLPGNVLAVKAKNVDQLTVLPSEDLVDPEKPVVVKVGGRPCYEGAMRPELTFRAEVRDGGQPRWAHGELPPGRVTGLRKRRGLEGPVGDAFNSGFVILYGCADSDRTEANRLAEQWDRWTMPRDDDGRPLGHCPIKPAAQVTDADVKSSNLILFGRPETNPVLRKIAKQLPVKILRSGVVCGKAKFAGRTIGLRLVYPNPLNPERYVVVAFGKLPTRTKDIEALPWLFPDYVVFDESLECGRTVHPQMNWYYDGLETGEVVEAEIPESERPPVYLPDCFVATGFFGSEWQLEEETQWSR